MNDGRMRIAPRCIHAALIEVLLRTQERTLNFSLRLATQTILAWNLANSYKSAAILAGNEGRDRGWEERDTLAEEVLHRTCVRAQIGEPFRTDGTFPRQFTPGSVLVQCKNARLSAHAVRGVDTGSRSRYETCSGRAALRSWGEI